MGVWLAERVGTSIPRILEDAIVLDLVTDRSSGEAPANFGDML